MNVRFGTDGIRGRANERITPELALALGRALVAMLSEQGRPTTVAVARDTRPSGPMIGAALIAGICSAGGDAVELGVLPTPGLSALVPRLHLGAGVMITASHNPEPDNGLKVVDHTGEKLSDDDRGRIEVLLGAPAPHGTPGGVRFVADAGERYVAAVLAALPAGPWLAGRTLVVDAGNGAAVGLAARVVAALGAKVISIGEGGAINDGCGAMAPARLQAEVVRLGADAGIALDGDADRGVLVTATGDELDGDALLWLCAPRDVQLANGQPPVVVGTVMSNGGLEAALAGRGILLERTPVGDAFVAAAVREIGASIGAEPSGHVILSDGLPTADGLLACLRAIYPDPRGLPERLAGLRFFCQLNGKIKVPAWYAEGGARREELEDAVNGLCRSGVRVVVRPSGTEPVLRFMVEHPEAARAHAGLDRLRALLERA